MLHNGHASILIGCFVAFGMAVLLGLGILPGWLRDSTDKGHASIWALGSGFITAAMTFLFWQSQRLVFLDRICISQHDDTLKKESIYSLGGILRQSQKLLVLWDSTWSDRLWCQFEFSAFLSQRTDEQVLAIRPTFLGPCSCVVFIGISILMVLVTNLPTESAHIPMFVFLLVGLICGYFIVAGLRGYFCMVGALKQKMHSFSFDSSRAACCDRGHVFNGRQIMCDKQIVNECVSIWFGHQEAFENYVRSKVADNLAAELECGAFTRSWSLSVTIPFLWTACDLFASQIPPGDFELAIGRFLAGFVLWFLCGPILIDYSTYRRDSLDKPLPLLVR